MSTNFTSRFLRPAASRIAIAGMAAVLISLSGFAIWASRATNDAVSRVSEVSALSAATSDAATAVVGEESLAREYLLTPTAAGKAIFTRLGAKLVAAMTVLKTGGDASERSLANRVLRLQDAYVSLSEEFFAAMDRGDRVSAATIHQQMDLLFDSMRDEISVAASDKGPEAKDAITSLHRLQAALVGVTAPAFAVGLLMLTVFGAIILAFRRSAEKQTEEAEYRALHDVLTGLPNRALFRDRGERALAAATRHGTTGAVMVLDLDRFKEVNDTLGHEQGDELLRQVATRLQQLLRHSDTVARFGGDEFTVLLPGVADGAAAMTVAKKMAHALESSFVISDVALDLEVSIGVSTFPEHGLDVDTLLRRADAAMFVSKENHTSTTLYTSALDAGAPTSLSLLGDLRRAIDAHDLVLHYQPKADLASNQVTGVEALVRWQHPDLGLIPPAEFIPLAERTGLIHPLTQYVLDQALCQVHAWRQVGIEMPVAVNISARNLVDQGFPQLVARLLEKWQVPAGMLELEITENSIMADPQRARDLLLRLTDLGVSLSIDDFGTGYSSLAYINDLPVHELKIDRSFVSELRGHAASRVIVNSIISLGRNLGLKVVAEGVEDELVWRELAQLGCDMAQGYHLARPMPAEAVAGWWLAWRSGQIHDADATVRAAVA